MKKILFLVLSLTVIAAVCSASLAYINRITALPIKEMKVKRANDAALAVMPEGVVRVEKVESGKVEVFVGRNAEGAISGFALAGSDAGGYGGVIELMVGFDVSMKIVTYKALQATETPGLGTKLSSPEFYSQFAGMTIGKDLAVVKDGGRIEAITSATITSRAVCRAIKDAADRLGSVEIPR